LIEHQHSIGYTGDGQTTAQSYYTVNTRVVNNTFKSIGKYQYQYFLILMKQYQNLDRFVFNINHAISTYRNHFYWDSFQPQVTVNIHAQPVVTTLPDAEKLAW